MPRASAASKTKKSDKVVNLDKAEGRDEIAYADKQGVFDFVVLTFTGKTPLNPDYDKEKDHLMIGFRYGSTQVPKFLPLNTPLTDVTPYDFLTNPRTGFRQGETSKPHGSGSVHLKNGIGDWSDIPPLYIWKQGDWLTSLIWDSAIDLDELPSWIKVKVDKAVEKWPETGVPAELYGYYITSGEGTPGNYLYRVFELPDTACGKQNPHHPLMWPEALRKPGYGTETVAYKGESWRPETAPGTKVKYVPQTPAKTTTTPVKKAPPLPAGLRYRCQGCGHWFNQGDLPGHAQVCGQGEEADWAIMCHADCGCNTLDQACKPKPGFPRQKKKEEKKEEANASSDTGTD